MDTIATISIGFTAAATVVIAIYACVNHRLTKAFQRASEQRSQEISDLYQAIAVATIIGASASRNLEALINDFKKHYTGKTEIF